MDKNLDYYRKELEKGAKKPISEENWKLIEKKFSKFTGFYSEIAIRDMNVFSRLVKAISENQRTFASQQHYTKSFPTTSVEVIQGGKSKEYGMMSSTEEAIVMVSNKDMVWELYLFQP